MGDADDGSLGHVGMADREVLEIDRGDPFPARLDDVLGAVGDLFHVAGQVQRPRRRRCRRSPARRGSARPRGNRLSPRPARAPSAAEGLAVPGLVDARIVGNSELDGEGRMALLDLEIAERIALQMRIDRLQRAE